MARLEKLFLMSLGALMGSGINAIMYSDANVWMGVVGIIDLCIAFSFAFWYMDGGYRLYENA